MTGQLRQLPTGLLRWLLRAPIYLYRWNLGWLLGSRFILLNHTGRKSGQPRQAVVEVVRHDRASDTFIIASGWGEGAQWYQNLLHHTDTTIQSGRRKLAVRAERLSQQEAAAELERYGRDHPRTAKELGRFLGFQWDGSPGQTAKIAAAIPILALYVKGTA